MQIALPADLQRQVDRELARGAYHDFDQLVEEAVRSLLANQLRVRERSESLRRISQEIDGAGLYE